MALDSFDLEGRDHDMALAASLEVEERIRDDDRHLVTHFRGAQSVGPDEEICHIRAKSYGFSAGLACPIAPLGRDKEILPPHA
jgi:hypothetical protein